MTIRSTDSQSAFRQRIRGALHSHLLWVGAFYFAYFNLAIGSSEIHAKHIFEYFLHL